MSERLTAEAFSALQRGRRSTRDFQTREVPPDVLERVIEDVKWSPSWSNTQPYVLALATGERLDRLRTAYLQLFDDSLPVQHGGWWAKVKMAVSRKGAPDGDFRTTIPYPQELQPFRRATGFGLYSLLGIDRKDRQARDDQMRRNFEFFGAPAVFFVFVHGGLKQWAVQDGGIVLQSLMLSLEANGLGSCAQGAIATWASPLRKEFDIPEDYKFTCALAFGYASDAVINTYNPGRRDVKVYR